MYARALLIDPAVGPAEAQARLTTLGAWSRRLEGAGATLVTLEPPSPPIRAEALRDLPGVLDVLTRPSPHPRLDALRGRGLRLNGRDVGPDAPPFLIAGPCSVEGPEQIRAAARMARAAGATLLRGGAFKPRTSPYAFQGHGREALAWMAEAAEAEGLGLITEVMDGADVGAVAEVAEVLQVGSRNMQNFSLLRQIGAAGKPVLLKRGMAATLEEWRLAAEHLLDAGAAWVIFCERGVRGFDPSARNLLDLGAAATLARVDGLLVVVDPSHAAGRRDLIAPLSHAALAAGACGLMIEAHPDPAAARSDGPQSLDAPALRALSEALRFIDGYEG